MTVTSERVRGYQLLERAGQDGPWTGYRARAEASGAQVLVKTLACHRVNRRSLRWIVRRFSFPETLAAHPGVIPVLKAGATGDGRPYLVTPLHDGLTLAERPGRSLPMPVQQATGLLRSVARALAATHDAGGAHGRVKPENVIMTGAGVMLTGYGMSALMSVVELPDGVHPSIHAAPEELEGRPPEPASDVYALGSMVYELLAGRPAFQLDGVDSTAKFVLGVLTEQPAPLPSTVPPDLAQLITETMAKDPAARPTAAALAALPAVPAPSGAPPTLIDDTIAAAPPVRTVRLPAPSLSRPLAVPATGSGQPRLSEEPAELDRSEPRELVWTVDPDRSQVRPPATPQPFLPSPGPAAPADPRTPEPDRGWRVPLVVAGVVTAAVLIGGGSMAVAVSVGSGSVPAQRQPVAAADPDGNAMPSPSDLPTADAPTQAPQDTAPRHPATSSPDRRILDAATVAAHRPRALKLIADNGSTVTLSWKAVRKTGYPVIIQQAPDDRLMSAAGTSTTYTVGSLDPVKGYCFKVGTVVALGQPSSVAWSSALCIRGAAEAGQDDQDGEVEPPIVLPPATPPPS